MGFFKRKKDEEVKIQLEREAMEKLNGNKIELFETPDGSSEKNSFDSDWRLGNKARAPHTITAEELNAKAQKSRNDDTNTSANTDTETDNIPMTNEKSSSGSPSDFLFQRMMNSRNSSTQNMVENSDNQDVEETFSASPTTENISDNTPAAVTEIECVEPKEEPKTYVPLDIEAVIDDLKNSVKQNSQVTNESPQAKESDADTIKETADSVTDSTAEILTEKTPTHSEIDALGSNAEERRATLLARCNAYLKDDSAPVKIDTEKYKLESVESILESFEARAAERINKRFSAPVNSDSSASASTPTTSAPSSAIEENNAKENTVVFKTSLLEKISADKISDNTDSNPVKHIFTADTSVTTPSTDTNDFSSTRIISDISSHSEGIDISSSSKTAVFPVVEAFGATLEKESNNYSKDENAESDTAPSLDDYTSVADRQKVLKSLVKNKKSYSVKTFFTLIIFALSVVTLVFGDAFGNQNIKNIFDLVLCLLVGLVNLNTLPYISTLFSAKGKNGLPASLSIIASVVFSVINLAFKGDFTGFSAVTAFSLLSYNLANRNSAAKTIKNFNLIANPEFKNAVSIIQNKAATKAIVGKAIEGSSLVCYGGETTNIRNFLKYSYCKNPISEKIQKISLISLIISICLALATLFLSSGGWIFATYIFAASVCFSAVPSVYHIVSLTINCANRRLNHYDAMITGYRAADELELCNGIAISSDALFPNGTIRLVDMKLLSPNPFDQSMLDAAAIASAIHSPITGIFEQMDISKSYTASEQEVDTVIYEEKMGISGWVNDRRVFVGNRDLLIAHGFSGLPPAELDKKIMHKGFFPIYIASDNIPCALLVVKYEPDENIIYEMQRLANTGTTIIVENCDPNISANMLTDYFELYNDTVFVMNKQGSDYYKALTAHKEHRNAGAAYKSRIEGLLATLTASINIKKYISRMTGFYIFSVILGLLGIIACIFTSMSSLISPLNILLVQVLLTVITLLPTILRKP